MTEFKTEMTERMKVFANAKHDQPSDCQRYGNKPYTAHLDDVVAVGLRYLYYIPEEDREDVICMLRGHDLVEDTDVSVNELEKMFNTRIADIIFRVSNERGWNRKEKNFKTYPKIWVKDYAVFVKLCDRIANTTNSKNTVYRMFGTYREEYPVFRYAIKVRELYPNMWTELDELNGYFGIASHSQL